MRAPSAVVHGDGLPRLTCTVGTLSVPVSPSPYFVGLENQ